VVDASEHVLVPTVPDVRLTEGHDAVRPVAGVTVVEKVTVPANLLVPTPKLPALTVAEPVPGDVEKETVGVVVVTLKPLTFTLKLPLTRLLVVTPAGVNLIVQVYPPKVVEVKFANLFVIVCPAARLNCAG
jgi:hypothetical protein